MAGRSDEERERICKNAVQIEKAGGDVLAYLSAEGYKYTTKATWINMQKDILKRNDRDITDGKPREIEKKEDKEVAKTRARSNPSELAVEVAHVVISGHDPLEYLKEIGYVKPELQWRKLRKILQEEDIDLLQEVDEALIKDPEPEKPQKAPSKREKEKVQNSSQKEPETPQDAKLEAAEVNPGHVCTCCAKSTREGVEVPDELPDEPLEVVAVMSRVKKGARYQKTTVKFDVQEADSYVFLIWRDLVNHEERELGMTADEWKALAKEIPSAMKALGY